MSVGHTAGYKLTEGLYSPCHTHPEAQTSGSWSSVSSLLKALSYKLGAFFTLWASCLRGERAVGRPSVATRSDLLKVRRAVLGEVEQEPPPSEATVSVDNAKQVRSSRRER